MVYQLIYSSRAQNSIDVSTIEQISYLASGRNPKKELSGIIIYAGKTILQVLEGPQEAVEDMFDKISRDTRHSEVMVLAEGHTDRREFETLGMNFKHVKAGEKNDLLTALVEQDFGTETDHFADTFFAVA